MYTVINTADSEATSTQSQPPKKKKRTRPAGKVNGGGNSSAADPGERTPATTTTTDDVSDGFTPTWREESDLRAERRREVVVNYTGDNSAPTSQTARGPYGSVGENSGTHLIDEEEEERAS